MQQNNRGGRSVGDNFNNKRKKIPEDNNNASYVNLVIYSVPSTK